MPHVIIRAPGSLQEFSDAFEPSKHRLDDGTIIELRGAYLRHDGRTVLVETTCLELGPAQTFFVAIERKKEQATVRCFPFPSPHRTAGVKRAISIVADVFLRQGGEIERANVD